MLHEAVPREEEEEVFVELTREAFNKLDEYSCSIPTGKYAGKQWKCNEDAYSQHSLISRTEDQMAGVFPRWYLVEYYELDPPKPGYIGIRRWRIKLKE